MWEQGGWVPEEGLVKVPCLLGKGFHMDQVTIQYQYMAPYLQWGHASSKQIWGDKTKKRVCKQPLVLFGMMISSCVA